MHNGSVPATGYLPRTIEPILRRAAREFPAVVVTGPRQSGKTTLLRHLFGRTHEYVSLEAPDVRAAAAADPRGFLDLHPTPVILDEIQSAPDLLPYIKERIDARREQRGRFLLAGSQNLALAHRVSESLAGRAGVFTLLPMSLGEAVGRRGALPLWSRGPARRPVRLAGVALWDALVRGSYPELVAEPGRDARSWQASYVHTYLERDVRSLRQVGDLTLFQSFLRMVAARSGQLFNLADLSRDLGVAVNTVKAWLGVLEATYQVVVVRPYFANVGKRLVKTPKVYLLDTGILAYLGLARDGASAAAGPLAGALFETAVVAELVKAFLHHGLDPRVYFWRTATNHEVDFIVDTGSQLVPIEAKASSTPRPEMASGILGFRRDVGGRVAPGLVVHAGDLTLPLGSGVTAVPFGAF